MSVWESIESLRAFVYQSIHRELLRDKNAWFNKMASAHQALWWVPIGYTPSIDEGVGKLEVLDKKGCCQEVFTFSKSFTVGTECQREH